MSIHKRRSVRLKEYDYASPGGYYLTICAHNRECIFGAIIDGHVELNELGQIVHNEWLRSGDIRSEIVIDEFIVMPNHVHGIVIIGGHGLKNGVGPRVGAYGNTPLQTDDNMPLRLFK